MSAMRQSRKDDDAAQRPAIVKKGELESLDLLGSSDDCWASSAPDVDYSQRLVFSDEEDFAEKRSAFCCCYCFRVAVGNHKIVAVVNVQFE